MEIHRKIARARLMIGRHGGSVGVRACCCWLGGAGLLRGGTSSECGGARFARGPEVGGSVMSAGAVRTTDLHMHAGMDAGLAAGVRNKKAGGQSVRVRRGLRCSMLASRDPQDPSSP